VSTDSPGIWTRVAGRLRSWTEHPDLFRYGQADSLAWIARRIEQGGFVLADEVGLGKTRLSLLVMIAALEEGANVVAVVPPGLMFQWQQEATELQRELSRLLPHAGLRRWAPLLVRSYDQLFDGIASYPLADCGRGRWVLVSQTFDIYQSRQNARAWRLELPALVRACRETERNENAHGNNRWVAYVRARETEGRGFIRSQQRAARYLTSQSYPADLEAVFEDERIRPYLKGGNVTHDACAAFFRTGKPGRRLLMHLVGRLIGPVDLLVVDEAHKSREDGDEPQKRLGRLLGEVLWPTPDTRRVTMTATPIELGPAQWRALLKRTGIGTEHAAWPKLDHAITEFSLALSDAGVRPDQPAALDRLLLASRGFEGALSPFVTRRRRLHQKEMQVLLPPALPGAHPHRALRTHVIEVEGLDEHWRRFVLAAEAHGLAAKGLTALGQGERQADIRYASGLGTRRASEAPAPDDTGEKKPRKDRRVAAWRRLKEQLEGTSEARLWTHPRVVAGADRIERMCDFDGLTPREKVLVFGTFTGPIAALRDLLNARHVLRAIDLEAVAALPAPLDPQLLWIAYEARRQQGGFMGLLAGKPLRREDLVEQVKQARARYERARDGVRAMFHGGRTDWIALQPGDDALGRLQREAPEEYDRVFDTLRSEVFDVLLFRGEGAGNPSEVDALAHQAWIAHLNCMLHGEERVADEDNEPVVEGDAATDNRFRQLDARGDRLTPERISEYFHAGPRSAFCRLLDGSVAPKTRQAVQASFNRREVGPYVLVAQSMVGREGLNLHRACRRVFLFHPEWNPGVMEQQVGRVDRIESLWTRLAAKWMADFRAGEGEGAPDADSFPRIEVESLVFAGTYDDYQSRVLLRRRASLNAQLFGALLDEETLERVPPEHRERLALGAPDFGPRRGGT
jgi:hypothetical protein